VGRTFADYYLELPGWLSSLPTKLAQTLVNRAWISIQDTHNWSFLQSGIGTLLSTQAITTGSVTLTQFASTVQFDAAAQAALAGLNNPTIYKYSLRFPGSLSTSGSVAGSTLYNITGYGVGDGLLAGQAQLDRVVAEPSGAGQQFLMYRAYYGPPLGLNGIEVTDFRYYTSVYNPSQQYYFREVGGDIATLNARDPGRSDFANPCYLYYWGADSQMVPAYEMWPHTTAQMLFMATYQRAGAAATPTTILPTVIQEECLIYKSLALACDWAALQPSLKGVNWQAKKLEIMAPQGPYRLALQQSIRNDQGIAYKSVLPNVRELAAQAIGGDERTGYYFINAQNGTNG
jgi:hypothetical protein